MDWTGATPARRVGGSSPAITSRPKAKAISIASSPPLYEIADFPALQQLGRALWRDPGARGAALLVGAGFSRNAMITAGDARKPPLWGDLADEMRSMLYPDSRPPTDVLRLAEEFRTYFGQAALDDFIRERITDASWEPGSLHEKLVSLNWADVLTTNYDTLLERASQQLTARYYQVVRTEGDLARYAAPRVVKLHGTIGIDDHLILAEEDYRTYPVRHAAFVNLARQVFVENELCLVGFSGDDPNFLAWSGWVRDHLASNARRIYLMGVLRLGPAKRKLLEARNIAPIDLWPLVEHLDPADRDGKAIEMALDYLHAAKPPRPQDWLPGAGTAESVSQTFDKDRKARTDDAFAAERILETTGAWEADRLNFPGWLVPPGRVRRPFRDTFNGATALKPGNQAVLGEEAVSRYVREACWLLDQGYEPMDDETAAFASFVLDAEDHSLLPRSGRTALTLSLLRYAREGDDHEAFERWAAAVEGAGSDPDDAARVAYERCLRARDHLDLAGLEQLLPGLDGPDPIWRARRAGLLCELGYRLEAIALIEEVVRDLRVLRRSTPASLWVASRLAWADWLAAALRQDRDLRFQDWTVEYKELRTDPDDLIGSIRGHIRQEAKKAREKKRTIVPAFEAGSYSNPGETVYFGSRAATPLYQLSRLVDEAGVPLRLNHSVVVSEEMQEALDLDFEPTAAWHILLLRSTAGVTEPLFARYFSRIAIARLPTATIETLCERLRAVIDYWRNRLITAGTDKSAPREQLKVFIEALARLSIRARPADATLNHSLAMALAIEPLVASQGVVSHVSHLARTSAEAMTPEVRRSLATECLTFPLPGDTSVRGRDEWPDPLDWLTINDMAGVDGTPSWSARIEQLVEACGRAGTDRPHAARRLLQFANAGLLSPSQSNAWSEAVWAHLDDNPIPLPAGTNLYPHVFAYIPSPAGVDAEDRVRRRLFVALESSEEADLLDAIRVAGIQNRLHASMRPTPLQARALFDGFCVWRPQAKRKDDLHAVLTRAFTRSADRDAIKWLGSALALSIVPALSDKDRTSDRLTLLLRLIDETPSGFALAALPYFAGGDGHGQVVARLRRGLLSSDFPEVAGSCDALTAWLKLEDTVGCLSPVLIDHVVTMLEARGPTGLHVIGRCVRKLVVADRLDAPLLARVELALDQLYRTKTYDAIDLDDAGVVSISLVRAECVRLSRQLDASGSAGNAARRWIEAAPSDPLPEVRNARI